MKQTNKPQLRPINEDVAYQFAISAAKYRNHKYRKHIVNIRDYKQHVQDGLQYMHKYLQLLHNAELALANLDASDEELTELEWAKFQAEYKQILSVEHVQRVEVHDDRLSVHTDTVYLEHEGKRFRIGSMRVDLYYDSLMRVTNTSDPRYPDLMPHHPHVRDDCTVCFGNIKEAVLELSAAGEYATLVQVVVQFLWQFNTDSSYYKYLLKWPVVDADDNVLYEPANDPESAYYRALQRRKNNL